MLLEQKFLYVIIAVIAISIAFSFMVFYQMLLDRQNNEFGSITMQYNKTAMWQIHDVIVDGKITVFTNDPNPYVVLQVNKYYKNPQNATHLTIWGDFGIHDDYCVNHYDSCQNIVAYLFKDQNGIYHQGEVFGRITDSCDSKCITGIR